MLINVFRIAIRRLTGFYKTITWNIFLTFCSLVRRREVFTCLLINVMSFYHFIDMTGIPIRVFLSFHITIIRNVILLSCRSFFHRSHFVTIFFSHMTSHHLFIVVFSITILIFLCFYKAVFRNIFLRFSAFFTRRNFFTR